MGLFPGANIIGSVGETIDVTDPLQKSGNTISILDASTSQVGVTMLQVDNSDTTSTDIATTPAYVTGVVAAKADKVSGATAGDIATLTSLGDLADSGVAITLSSTANTNTQVMTSEAVQSAISTSAATKANLVSSATAGDIASLTSTGNLADSGASITTNSSANTNTQIMTSAAVNSAITTSIATKADLVSSPTLGDIASLSNTGNLVDSGVSITTSSIANLDSQIMTSAAVQSAISSVVTSAKSWRGSWDASTNLFPTTGGSGTSGAIQMGDAWDISVGGTLGGKTVSIGDSITSLENTPGQTSSNWLVGYGIGTLSNLLDTNITTPTSGQFLEYNGTNWVNYSLSAADIPALPASKITSGILSAAQLPAFTGDATSSAGTAALTLAASGVTPGSYPKVTVNNKGLVTSGAALASGDIPNLSATQITSGTLAAAQMPAFTGDTTSSAGSTVLTMAASGVSAGTYPKVTVNTKGIVTAGTALLASDIPNLAATQITSGTLAAAQLPAFTGDVTSSVGTSASTLVATSNSTLTTLSSLSLPYAQLSGTVPTWNQSTTGNAATATNMSGGAANQINYQTAANTTGFIAAANSSVLVTNGSGAPSLSTTLPAVISGATLVTDPSQGAANATPINTALANIYAGSAGTVSSVSIVSGNGFAGTVATATTTPAITLQTTVTGLVKGNGTAVSSATSGTDYSAGTSALSTGILKSTTGTGALTIAVAGDFPTLNQSTTGNATTATTATNLSGTTTNQIPYQTGSGTTGYIASANNSMLVTNGSGVPSISNTLPTGALVTLNTGLLNSSNIGLNYNAPALSTASVAMATTAGTWQFVKYGNGTFAAVTANSSAVNYSTNYGQSWLAGGNLPASGAWSIAYGNGRWVAIAQSSTNTAYNTDGNLSSAWTTGGATTTSASAYTGLTYGGGSFVAGTQSSVSSLNYTLDYGVTWLSATTPVTAAWLGIAYTGTKFVGLSYNSTSSMTSPTGATWTAGGTVPTGTWVSLAYGNGVLLGLAQNGSVVKSTDAGTTWASATAISTTQSFWNRIVWVANNTFIAISNNSSGNTVAYTTDAGSTWVASSSITMASSTGIAVGGGVAIIVRSALSSLNSFVIDSPQVNGISGNNNAMAISELFANNLVLPSSSVVQASQYNLGLVKPDNSSINVSSLGVISANSTSTPTASTMSQWDSNSNLSANNFLPLVTSIATASGTTTLTLSSSKTQVFTGTLGQTIVLPSASTLAMGTEYIIVNNSTGILTVQDGGATTLLSILPGATNTFKVISTGSTAGTWDYVKKVSGRVALNTIFTIGSLNFQVTTTGGLGFKIARSGSVDLTVHSIGNTFYGATPTYYSNTVAGTTISTTYVNPLSWTGTTNNGNTMDADLYDVTNGLIFKVKGIIASGFNYISVSIV